MAQSSHTMGTKRAEPFIPPPPTAAETFGNVSTNQVRHVDGRRNRPKKVQEQFNTKVREGFGDQVDDVRRQLEAELKRDVPRGELLEMMLGAFLAARAGENIKDALVAMRAPVPSPDDLAADRKQAMTFFATRAMEAALKERMQNLTWSLGGVVEDLLVKASRAVQPEKARK